MDTTPNATNPRSCDPRNDGLKAWLNVMNASLSALEQTLWQGRELAEQAIRTLQKVGDGVDQARDEYETLVREAAQWPARVKRMKDTGWMLTRITTSYRLWGIKSAFISRRKAPDALAELHRKNARLFRDVSLRQGGAFLKVGQLLSARADILPKPWVEELRVLQDQASPVPFEEVREVIETELGNTLDALFAEFDPEPIAAASIGQVHQAYLPNGQKVAVKIQRPGLAHIIDLDMTLLKLFTNSIASMLPPTDLDTITNEIERTIREELDYRCEARAMVEVGDFLRDVPKVTVPRPIPGFTRERVLVSTFIDGKPLMGELDKRQAEGDEAGLADLLGRLLDLYLRQVLQAGVFQADPHPGNLLVTADDTLVLLDFGCTMTLSEPFREGYFNVLGAALMGERDTMAKELLAMGFATRSGKPDTLLAFADALLSQIQRAAFEMSQDNPGWPSQGDMLAQAKKLLAQADADPVDKLPAEFIMLARVFTTLGGLFMHYQPKIDVNTYLFPHLVGPALSQAI
ncbi:ABC1 kinase family protein [Ketobacter sp.]|uniref:ABC1 kinase family protein n=1 Tax=Ketobacter sp. TaxID=2083498 RepID=UPI000F1FA99C|nr:AarF/UbiB family protein [Ketobacter sp.]RLU01189.1 MAG: AarF/ABC1/UbiB kinase family protein [Ketobacter sp.]